MSLNGRLRIFNRLVKRTAPTLESGFALPAWRLSFSHRRPSPPCSSSAPSRIKVETKKMTILRLERISARSERVVSARLQDRRHRQRKLAGVGGRGRARSAYAAESVTPIRCRRTAVCSNSGYVTSLRSITCRCSSGRPRDGLAEVGARQGPPSKPRRKAKFSSTVGYSSSLRMRRACSASNFAPRSYLERLGLAVRHPWDHEARAHPSTSRRPTDAL